MTLITRHKCDDMVLALNDAPVDVRTGNKVLYGASWIADNNSMIGKRNEDWVRRELAWFTAGSNNLNDMEPPVPKAFQQCGNDEGEVNSAYGHILFDTNMFDDGSCIYSRALLALIEEGLHTRHSIAIITDRDIHRISQENGKNDFICTNALNIMVDADYKVHLFAQMRSMDAVWGYRADYSMWDLLLSMIIDHLKPHYPEVDRGNIVFQVANLHVYPRHFDLLEEEAASIEDMLMRRVWKGVAQ